jgi:hypothetical protein
MYLNCIQKLNHNTSPWPLTVLALVHIGKNNTCVFSVAYTVGEREKQAGKLQLYVLDIASFFNVVSVSVVRILLCSDVG